MAELEWIATPPRLSLRRAIRHELRRLDRGLQIVAEEFLTVASPLDLLAVGSEGEIVSLRIGERDEDAALLTRSLSDLVWLRARCGDLSKLASGRGLDPSAEPRAVLLCPAFGEETRAAIALLPPRSIELIEYRCYRQRGQLGVLLEPQIARASTSRRDPSDSESESIPTRDRPAFRNDALPHPFAALEAPPEHPRRAGFRTGLTDADLRIDTAEPVDLDAPLKA